MGTQNEIDEHIAQLQALGIMPPPAAPPPPAPAPPPPPVATDSAISDDDRAAARTAVRKGIGDFFGGGEYVKGGLQGLRERVVNSDSLRPIVNVALGSVADAAGVHSAEGRSALHIDRPPLAPAGPAAP